MFDLDGSGEIDLGEIAKAFKSTGKFTDETRAQLEAHFAFMDSDGSGKVSFDEFRSAVGQRNLACRDYQHQQEYQSLGLALTQNLAVYRRHRLHKTFERMQEAEPGTLNHQFELLRQAQAMSTFALKLGPPTGKDYQSGSGGKLGTKAPVTRRAERRREVRAREETNALERVLRGGGPKNQLRSLPHHHRRVNPRELMVADDDAHMTTTKIRPNIWGKRRPAARFLRSLPSMQDCSV